MSSREMVAVRHMRPSGTLALADGREISVGARNARYLGFIQRVQMPRREAARTATRTATILGMRVKVAT